MDEQHSMTAEGLEEEWVKLCWDNGRREYWPLAKWEEWKRLHATPAPSEFSTPGTTTAPLIYPTNSTGGSEATTHDPSTQMKPVTSATGEKLVTDPKTGGMKGQKPARFDLIPSPFLWELALVYGKGAEKYDDDNWRKGYDWRLTYGALLRHLHLFWMGESIDPESGLHHLAHVAWHAATLFTFDEVGLGTDTRPDIRMNPSWTILHNELP